MITNTRNEIIDYIRNHGQARVKDLHETFKISKVAIHKQLKRLVVDGLLVRVGKSPLTFYTLPQQTIVTSTENLDKLAISQKQIIEANFLSITPDGKLLFGLAGFSYWVQLYQKNKQIEPIAKDYEDTLQHQRQEFLPEGYLDATAKLIDTFKETPITHLLFEDIYSYKIFGRTKLAKLIMYAKQVGEKSLIDQISDLAKPVIEAIVKKYSIDAVVYIPPTVPRPLQFMDELRSRLNLIIPELRLAKIVPGDIPIPQKTLTTLGERVINARDSIYLRNNAEPKYKNVLLIDDVVGSGASFNETAKKLKNANIGEKNIIAFGLVGNIKGYDIVREI